MTHGITADFKIGSPAISDPAASRRDWPVPLPVPAAVALVVQVTGVLYRAAAAHAGNWISEADAYIVSLVRQAAVGRDRTLGVLPGGAERDTGGN